jgi:hypothetical protein
MSYEKDKLDSYVTSASLSTALATYATSASVSSAIAAAVGAIDLSAYVSSNSLSAAVATDALTVRGAASVSATLSAGAVTVSGRPVGAVLLGYSSQTNTTRVRFSGSWSDFFLLELQIRVTAGGGTTLASAFTDGGTTPILAIPLNASIPAYNNFVYEMRVSGGDGQSSKLMDISSDSIFGRYANITATATAGFVNCLEVSICATCSVAFAALYGWRKA